MDTISTHSNPSRPNGSLTTIQQKATTNAYYF